MFNRQCPHSITQVWTFLYLTKLTQSLHYALQGPAAASHNDTVVGALLTQLLPNIVAS